MAQKKITDLQLIAAVVAGLNLPSDDGIQSYRCTAQQIKDYILATGNIELAMLAVNIFHGLTGVSAADDDYFILNDTSDSNKTKKALVSTFARNIYTDITAGTTLGTHRTAAISGATGNITFPANGTAGRRYTLVHDGTSLTQVYTFLSTGGAVFKTPQGSLASGDYKMYTKGETSEWEDDGTNWKLINSFTRTGLVSNGAITIGAITTPPTKDASPVLDRFIWSREGEFCNGILDLTQDSVGTAGSGNYLFTLPTNITFDSTFYSFFTTAVAQNAIGKSLNMVGHAYMSYGNTTNGAHGSCVAYDASTFRIFGTDSTNANTIDGSSNYGIGGAHANYHCALRFKVPGWRP